MVRLTRELTRELTLTVRGVAKATADLDDTLDAIVEQVEPVLNGSTLGGLAKNCRLDNIPEPEMDDVLETPAGSIRLVYRITYFTSPALPGTAL